MNYSRQNYDKIRYLIGIGVGTIMGFVVCELKYRLIKYYIVYTQLGPLAPLRFAPII